MRAWRLFLSAAVAFALGAGWACLPDLKISQPPPFCGDGVIDPDAGEECDPGDAGATASNGCTVDCKVRCAAQAPFVDPASHHCYFSADFTSEIGDAAARCEANGAHVVRFVSESEVSLVANGAPFAPFWVGLEETTGASYLPLPSETTNEPGWTPGCTGCFAHVPPGSQDIPDAAAKGLCVIGSKAQQGTSPSWTKSACRGAISRETICEREPVGTRTVYCNPIACITVAATKKRYALGQSPVTADDAVQTCASLGGHLVIFQSPEEREQLGYEIGTQTVAPSARDFWIGLATGGGAVWEWDLADAGGLTPQPWGDLQPTPVAGKGRAYVLVDAGMIDSELARAGDTSDPTQKHYALCEY